MLVSRITCNLLCQSRMTIIIQLYYTHIDYVFVCFSQAVVIDKTIYVSGQLGMLPDTGDLVQGGVEQEAEQVSQNVSVFFITQVTFIHKLQ